MVGFRWLSFAVLMFAKLPALAEEAGPPMGTSELIQRFQIKEARQGVGVDADAFYAVDNTVIAKYDKKTGALIAKWEGDADGLTIHLDSAAVVDGKLYAAHSNYPAWPMTSSIEIWDAATMKHIESHSLGSARGSLTWLDRDANGIWWGAFANYDRVSDKSPLAYGNKYNTQLVRFDANWRVAEAWVFPDALVEKFDDMSNSGGSWGPDGKLYVTGHDNAELYIMDLPTIGSELKWVGTIPAEIAGQGIAFDHSQPGVVYGVIRKKEGSEVTVSRVTPPVVN
ncbi:cycloisomerase [Dongia deserti]|uniref:cycloisomerase n=1 Tax=Dongia deserti TaxID=2268030 RepID=UPI000E64EBEF|nr:cycloisomerase [Dongia deserti]